MNATLGMDDDGEEVTEPDRSHILLSFSMEIEARSVLVNNSA